MTKDELLGLEPGTLVDVCTDGEFVGIRTYRGVNGWDWGIVVDKDGCHEAFACYCLSIHVPQPQVSGTIDPDIFGYECDICHEAAYAFRKLTGTRLCEKHAKCHPHFLKSIHEEQGIASPTSQVSGTIETPPKLYVFAYGNSMLASEDQIMAQECVQRLIHARDYWYRVSREFADSLKESQNTERVLNDEIAKRNETIHTLRMRVEKFETPPTTDEVKHAYNALIAGGNRDEARVLQTLSHVVERLSEELSAKSGGRN